MFDSSKFQRISSSITNPIRAITQLSTGGVSSLLSNVFPGVSGLINSGFSLGSITKQISIINDNVGSPIKGDVVPNIDDSSISRLEPPKLVETVEQTVNKNKKEPTVDVYPDKLDYSKYRMELQFGEYVRPYYGQTSETKFKPSYIAHLPLPPQLIDSQNLGWSPNNTQTTGLISNIAQSAGVTTIQNGMINSVDQLKSKFTEFNFKSSESQSFFDRFSNLFSTGGYLLANLNPAVTQGIGGVLGLTPNPFPGAYYVGPDLRAFQFSWLFAPETIEESVKLKNILKQIRARTLSQPIDRVGAFLQYPEIARIILHPTQTFDDLFPFKECALTNITIDYTPFGLSFHTDQTPTLISLSLLFSEIQPLFRTDIDTEFEGKGLLENRQADRRGN